MNPVNPVNPVNPPNLSNPLNLFFIGAYDTPPFWVIRSPFPSDTMPT
jgi:hypothetical protein